MSGPLSDTDLEELLGAYAVDACEPEEVSALEQLFLRRPDLAREAARLAETAVWIGASGALEPPPTLRRPLFEQARFRRADPDPPARLFRAEVDRLAEELDLLEADHDDVVTANGLTARDLVVHLGAQESLLARSVGRLVEPRVDVVAIEGRTAAFIERFRDAPYEDVVAFWQRAVSAVATWCAEPASRAARVEWLGLDMPRDQVLVARAFENWTHRDDLRRVRGQPSAPPPPRELQLMADMSLRTLPLALAATDRTRPGCLARVVLRGPGGGEWPVSMGPDVPSGAEPAVTLTADVLDWCRHAAERLPRGALSCLVDGDEDLADDLLAAASAFATL